VTSVRVVSDRRAEYVELLEAAGVTVAVEADVLLADPRSLHTIDLAGVTWIQSTWAGVDAVDWSHVPADATVTGLPGVFGHQIAEYVFGHLLGRTQRVPQRHAVRVWDETLPDLLGGTTLGVLGAGSIGGCVAEVARAFGMVVRGCRRSGAPDSRYDRMYPMTDLPGFTEGVDHLVAVLPATPETRAMVDGAVLGRLTPGATFVNVGRGSTAVTDDVVAAARSGRLGLAVLDVTDPEPLPPDHPAWAEANVVITGHTAAHSRPDSIVRFFLENLARLRSGEQLVGVVDRSKGY